MSTIHGKGKSESAINKKILFLVRQPKFQILVMLIFITLSHVSFQHSLVIALWSVETKIIEWQEKMAPDKIF